MHENVLNMISHQGNETCKEESFYSHWNSFNYISICVKNIKLHKYLGKQFGSFLTVLIYDGTKFGNLKTRHLLSQFLRVRNLGAI